MTLVQMAQGYASHEQQLTTQSKLSEAGFDSLALGSFAAELSSRSGVPVDLMTMVEYDALEVRHIHHPPPPTRSYIYNSRTRVRIYL